ncbi:nuclear transport factor 2 family protein [Ectothiorhodospiraceae bacterium 2226]|nr:nuclear transport factor 2 family protein [Ectothiorhodospiraceae bacterium 2226]
MATRSAREVLADHLRLAQAGEVEADLARNFAPDVVLLSAYGVFRGHEGVRRAARLLAAQLPGGRWEYRTVLVEGELGFLEWGGRGTDGVRVEDGADSFVIRDGRIRAMTMHYTVLPPATSRS